MSQELITERDARVLNAARVTLKAIQDRATDYERRRALESSYDVLSLGRIAQAADAAESMVFDLLNVTASHVDDPVASAWVHGDPREKQEAAVPA